MGRMCICYNCAGDVIGLINENFLYAANGKFIGCFNKSHELYDSDYNYIGELVKFYVDRNSGKTYLNDSAKILLTPDERLMVAIKKKGKTDSSVERRNDSTMNFDENLYKDINIIKEIPSGYEDFVVR